LYVDVSFKYWLSTFFQEKQYTCIDCDKKYCHKKDLVAHKNAAHGMSEFRCKECSSVFGYETALKRHVRSKHEGKRCVCSVCRNTFTYRANYVRHLKMKHRDVNWKCRVFTNTLRLMINKKHLKAIKVFCMFYFHFQASILFNIKGPRHLIHISYVTLSFPRLLHEKI
jgi:uncharacterized C2H2 Zn-finger protein